MSSRAISGKPGGGKSYYATSLVIQELLDTDRAIVTNIPLIESRIAEVLAEKGKQIDVYSRIVRLDEPKADEAKKLQSFWRYRAGGVILPDISQTDIKAGVRPDEMSFGSGVHYFLDEWHKFCNSRQWAETGPLILWYISQHRHFGDDVTWITQHVQNVDKQWRSVTQDYTYVRNFSKEKFRGFTKGGSFHRDSFLEPFTGLQTPQESEDFKPDWKGVGSCYHTSIAHGAADKGQKAKGLPVWVLYVGIVVVCALVALGFMYGPNYVAGKMIKKSDKDAAVLREKMAASSPSAPATVGKFKNPGSAPLDTPDLNKQKVEKEIINLAVPLANITSGEAVFSLGSLDATVMVKASPFGQSVIVSGSSLQNVTAAAQAVKMMDSARASTVMIQAVVARTTKGKSSNVGIWHTLQDVVASGGFGLGNLAFDPMTGIISMGSVTAAKEVIRIMGSQNIGRSNLLVESRPVIATTSGTEAWFSSGQEVPVPVTTQTVGNSQTSIQYKTVQFSLGVLPVVLPDGSIALTVKQSNADIVGESTIAGNTVPTVASQSLYTRLSLHEGQVAVIGGIHVSNRSDDSNSFPVLGAIPPLSWLLGNRDKKTEESELVIMLTVYRVENGSNPLPVRRAELVKLNISQNGKNARGVSSYAVKKKEQIR